MQPLVPLLAQAWDMAQVAAAYGIVGAATGVSQAQQRVQRLQQQQLTQPPQPQPQPQAQVATPQPFWRGMMPALRCPTLLPVAHLRTLRAAILEGHDPLVSPDGRVVTLSLEKALGALLHAHPPKPTTTTISVVGACDGAGFNKNQRKGLGGQSTFATRLKSHHGHEHAHKPLGTQIVAFWEGGDKYENMSVNLSR